MSTMKTPDAADADHFKMAVELLTIPFHQRMSNFFSSMQENLMHGKLFIAIRKTQLQTELLNYRGVRLQLIQDETTQIFAAIQNDMPEKITVRTVDDGLTDSQIAEQKKLLSEYVSQSLMHFEEFQRNAIKYTERDMQRFILICAAVDSSLEHVVVSFSPLSVPYVGPNDVLPEEYRVLVEQATFSINEAYSLITKQFGDDATAKLIIEEGTTEIEEHVGLFPQAMGRKYIDGLNRITENVFCRFIDRFEKLNEIRSTKRECPVRKTTAGIAADQPEVANVSASSPSASGSGESIAEEDVGVVDEPHLSVT